METQGLALKVGSRPKKVRRLVLADRVRAGFIREKSSGVEGPLPYPARCLDWRGFYKNALQHLEPQRLRSHNLDNKGLVAFFVGARRYCLRQDYPGVVATIESHASGPFRMTL